MKKVIASCLQFRCSISSNYLVPYIAARPYLNKPLLINWIVAAAFKLSGVRNEWTARLPSALFILAVALTLATVGRISLGQIGSFIAALCWLTNLGLIEKGRMIEIEAIYCSLFAFALILWLLLWEQKRSPQAYLRRALDLSWFRPAGERSKSRPVLLSYRWRRSLAKSSPPRPNSPGALHWSRGNARNFCDLADSVLSDVTFSVALASLVMRSGGRISRRRRQIRGLVTKLPPRLRLSTSLGTTSPVYSIE